MDIESPAIIQPDGVHYALNARTSQFICELWEDGKLVAQGSGIYEKASHEQAQLSSACRRCRAEKGEPLGDITPATQDERDAYQRHLAAENAERRRRLARYAADQGENIESEFPEGIQARLRAFLAMHYASAYEVAQCGMSRPTQRSFLAGNGLSLRHAEVLFKALRLQIKAPGNWRVKRDKLAKRRGRAARRPPQCQSLVDNGATDHGDDDD